MGANIGIHWIGDSYTSNTAAGVLRWLVEGKSLLGNGTGVWVHTDDRKRGEASRRGGPR